MLQTPPVLYHHTDTTRLSWILFSGELQPGKNAISKLPFDFLWATTNPNGDRTAAARSGPSRTAYRAGSALAVRFTLPEDGFLAWKDVPAHFPEWTPEHVARTEGLARTAGESGFAGWYCRKDALPIDGLPIETKGWAGDWTPLKDRPRVGAISDGKGIIGMSIILGRTVYQSFLASKLGQMPTGYVTPPPMDVDEFMAQADSVMSPDEWLARQHPAPDSTTPTPRKEVVQAIYQQMRADLDMEMPDEEARGRVADAAMAALNDEERQMPDAPLAAYLAAAGRAALDELNYYLASV